MRVKDRGDVKPKNAEGAHHRGRGAERAHGTNVSVREMAAAAVASQQAQLNPRALSPSSVLALQRTVGNATVSHLLRQRLLPIPAAERNGHSTTVGEATLVRRMAAGAGVVPAVQRDGAATGTSKKERDLATLLERIGRIKGLNNPTFVTAMTTYIDLLTGGQDDAAKDKLNEILGLLDDVHAFEIPFHLHNAFFVQGEGALAAEAGRRTNEIHLWSKMYTLEAIKHARESGISLEGSLGGWLFDGLDFGVAYATSPAMQYQWRVVSERFMMHAAGGSGEGESASGEQPQGQAVVHAHVLFSLPFDSVLFTTELPKIKAKMQQGLIKEAVVHRYVVSNLGGAVQEVDQKIITAADEWTTFLRAGQRGEDDENTLKVQVGQLTIKRPDGSTRTVNVVARLSLYMNERDWQMVRGEAWERSARENEPSPKQKDRAELDRIRKEEQDALAKIAADPTLSDAAKAEETRRIRQKGIIAWRKAWHGKYASPIYGGGGVGVQNLAQTGQSAGWQALESELWKEGQQAEEAALATQIAETVALYQQQVAKQAGQLMPTSDEAK